MNIRRSLISAVIFLTGCSLPVSFDATEHHWYRIPDLTEVQVVESSPYAEKRLVVGDAQASSFVASHKILFSDDGTEQGFYQFASWTETPAVRVTAIVLDALERAKMFRSVSHISLAPAADYQLGIVVHKFFHDLSSRPGVARVDLTFELLDLRTRDIVASRRIRRNEPLEKFDSRGAVDALGRATHGAVREMLEWLRGETAEKKGE